MEVPDAVSKLFNSGGVFLNCQQQTQNLLPREQGNIPPTSVTERVRLQELVKSPGGKIGVLHLGSSVCCDRRDYTTEQRPCQLVGYLNLS